MTPISDVRVAFQKKLVTITNPLPTKWDNNKYTPNIDTAYQIANLKVGSSEDLSLAFDGVTEDLGFFQINLLYPLYTNPSGAEQRANELATLFIRGTRLTENDTLVRINKSPEIRIIGENGDRYSVIITVYYQATNIV